MKVALIQASFHEASHRVRGAGVYAQSLEESLKKYYPENEYVLASSEANQEADLSHFLYFEPFFRTLPLLKKGKRVVTVHDLTPFVFPENFPAGIKGTLRWQLQKLALKNSDLVITDSISSKRDICKYASVKRDNIRVVYLAPSDHFKKLKDKSVNLILRKYKLPERFALYVGDATWNKNLVRLLKATKLSEVPLVMVGKALLDNNFDKNNPWNIELAQVHEMASKNINIVRLGFVSNEDLVALYNKATLFVMPSVYEGFGLPLLEAMACGTPILTSEMGSIPEVTGNASFNVDPFDVEEIASGIKRLTEDQILREKLIARGFSQVKKFTWEKTAKETLDCYNEVLKQG